MEMGELVNNGKKFFQLNRKEKKVDQGWEKIQSELERRLNQLKDSLTPNNMFEIVFKVMNAREALLKQFFKCLLYRKNSLWLDLNVPF